MLEIKSITMKYEKTIIDHVSYIFPKTGFIGLSGPSGCGKTTLLYILSGMLQPTNGEVLYNKEPIDDDFLRNHISFIKQNNDLFDALNVKDNIEAGCKLSSIKMPHTLVSIASRLEISTLLRKYPHQLSVGQRKRVSIARAILKNTDIVLCDEPTGALHNEASREVMELLRHESKKRLIIIVSHSLSLLEEYCDDIIFMKEGKLIGRSAKIYEYNEATVSKKKYSYIHYALMEIRYQLPKLISLFLFEVILLTSIYMMLSGMNGFNVSIENSLKYHPMKNITLLEKKNGEEGEAGGSVRAKFMGESGRVIEHKEAMIEELPLNLSHVKLVKGRKAVNENECLVSESLYSLLKDKHTLHYELDKNYPLLITGVIKEYFFTHPTLYITSSFTSLHSEFLSTSQYEVEDDYNKVKKAYKDYNVTNQVIEEKENYDSIIQLGMIILIIFILISFMISYSLMKVVYQSIGEDRKHDFVLSMSLGRSRKSLKKQLESEGTIIGVYIQVCAIAFYYAIAETLNTLTSFVSHYHFTFIQPKVLIQGDFIVLIGLIMISLFERASKSSMKQLKQEDVVNLLREED